MTFPKASLSATWTKDFRHWYSRQRSRDEAGPVLATFMINARPDGRAPAKDPAGLGLIGYRRPPATVSYDDLSARGLRRVLFVNTRLPEGVAAYDLPMFAEMIREAYHGGSLRFIRQDHHGSDQCVGLGTTGIWEWQVVRPGKPIDGERYSSPQQGICRILFAPEKDGKRVCTVDLNGYPGHEPEDDSPIIFTIRTRTTDLTVLAREAATRDPADVAEAVEMSLTWLANTNPAAARLLRMLAFLPDVPVPLRDLLFTGQPAADLPAPEAAAMIGPALNNPYNEALKAMHHDSLVSHTEGLRVQLHPLARAAIRAQLTADEAAHWQQAGTALIEGALPSDPQDPATWLTYQRLLPLARAALDPAGEGRARIARYLAASGRNEPPDVERKGLAGQLTIAAWPFRVRPGSGSASASSWLLLVRRRLRGGGGMSINRQPLPRRMPRAGLPACRVAARRFRFSPRIAGRLTARRSGRSPMFSRHRSAATPATCLSR